MHAPSRSAVAFHVLGMILLAVVAIASVAAVAPPNARPKDAPPAEFSAERARDHLAHIADAPHPVGSLAHAKVRDFLVRATTDLGFTVEVQEGNFSERVVGNVFSAHLFNVVARRQGVGSGGKAVVLAAHYDSVPQSYGASDDGAAVAAILEAARALSARPPLDRDLILLFTDGEEMGLLGAQLFVREHRWAKDVGVALNFEARGSHGTVAMFDPSAKSGALIEALAAVPTRISASSFVAVLAQALPNDTDTSVFKRAGIPSLGFAYADGLEHYHRASDSLATVSLASLQHEGEYALALADRLGRGSLDLKGPDVVYFDLFERILCRYPAWLAQLLAVGTLALFLVRARREATSLGRVVGGAGGFLLVVVAALLATTGVHLLVIQAIEPWFVIARSKPLTVQGLLVATAVFVALYGWRLRKGSAADLALGVELVWLVLLCAAAAQAPGLTPVFQWPLAFVLLGRFLGTPTQPASLAVFYLSRVPAVGLFSVVVFSVMVAAGAGAPAVPGLFFLLLLGLFVPLLERVPPLYRRALVAGALAGSLVPAGIAIGSARFSAAEPRTDSVVYGLDLDQRRAYWLNQDPGMDDFVIEYLPAGARSNHFPQFSAGDDVFRFAPAPVVVMARGDVEVRTEPGTAGGRSAAVRVRPVDREARCVGIWQEAGLPIRDVSINGQPVHEFFRFSPELDERLFRLVMGNKLPRGFRMEACGFGHEGIDLGIRASGGDAVGLRVLEILDGLPSSRAIKPLRRPQGFEPAERSDVTLVGRRISL